MPNFRNRMATQGVSYYRLNGCSREGEDEVREMRRKDIPVDTKLHWPNRYAY